MNSRLVGVMNIVLLLLLAPQFAFALWKTSGEVTSHRSCLECICLGPFADGGTDAAIGELCDNIVRAPCQSHVKTGVIGSWQFISANDPKCNIIWAPTKAECVRAYGGLQAQRSFDMCAAIQDVVTFGNQRAGAIGMGGQCIPSGPRAICG